MEVVGCGFGRFWQGDQPLVAVGEGIGDSCRGRWCDMGGGD